MGKLVIQIDEGFAAGKGKSKIGIDEQSTTGTDVVYEVKG